MNLYDQSDTSPLRICLLSYRSNPYCGGQGVYVRNLSRALKALGHHVEVVSGPPYPILDADIPLHSLPSLDLYNPNALFRVPTLREFCSPVNILEWMDVSTMGFPEPLTFGMRAYDFLRNRLGDYDVIHDNQTLSYGIWAIGRRVPLVTTIHHPMTVDRDLAIREASKWWEKLKAIRWYSFIGMQKRVAQRLSSVITVPEYSANHICKEFHIPLHSFRVVPNGIDTEQFHPMPSVKRLPHRILTTNSADMPLKGLAYLLEAVACLRKKKRRIELNVVGRPKKNGMIEKMVAGLNLRGSVRFLGRIDDREFVRQYARAGMAVIPSLYEGFGLPAGEAMACGVPVISTTGGALPEVVGDAGLLVPPADAGALEHAICHLLDHPETAEKIGQAGLNRVGQLFTWENAARQTAEIYREAIREFV